MPNPPLLKLTLIAVAVLTVTGVGYAGLMIWRDRAVGEIRDEEFVREEESTQEGKLQGGSTSRQEPKPHEEKTSERLNAAIEQGFVIVRDVVTSQEISRIPERTYIEFLKRDLHRENPNSPSFWGISSVVYVVVNENLHKLYVFVSDPELSGATGNLVGRIVESNLDGTNRSTLSEWGGSELDGFKFSPQDKYLSYHALWRIGAGKYSSSIKVHDIVSKRTYTIDPSKDRNAGIHSYKWIDPKSIELILSLAQFEPLSPTQTWHYDLDTGEYKLIKSESEEP